MSRIQLGEEEIGLCHSGALCAGGKVVLVHSSIKSVYRQRRVRGGQEKKKKYSDQRRRNKEKKCLTRFRTSTVTVTATMGEEDKYNRGPAATGGPVGKGKHEKMLTGGTTKGGEKALTPRGFGGGLPAFCTIFMRRWKQIMCTGRSSFP